MLHSTKIIHCLPYETLIRFFFNDTATTEIYTLSLHDALPICDDVADRALGGKAAAVDRRSDALDDDTATPVELQFDGRRRSEEHTSELQSLTNLVCRLLLDKRRRHYRTSSSDHSHTPSSDI